MVTEVERETAMLNWQRAKAGDRGSGGGGGSDDDRLGGGDMGRDRRLLLEILDDLIADLGIFGEALQSPAFYEFVAPETDREELAFMGQLAQRMIVSDAAPKLQTLRKDLDTQYPLRHAFLFSAGLTGDPLFFKRQVSRNWRLTTNFQWASPFEVAGFLKRARENFEMGAKILGSLEEALKEFPGIKTLLEAIDELLSIFDFWSRHISRQQRYGGYRVSEDFVVFADE